MSSELAAAALASGLYLTLLPPPEHCTHHGSPPSRLRRNPGHVSSAVQPGRMHKPPDLGPAWLMAATNPLVAEFFCPRQEISVNCRGCR